MAISSERPNAVRIAVALLLTSFAAGVVLSGERFADRVSQIPTPIMVAMFAISFLIMAALVLLVFGGHNWARIACVALVAVRSISAVYRSAFEFGFPSIAAALSLTLVAVEIIAAILLLSGPSNTWFRRSRPEP